MKDYSKLNQFRYYFKNKQTSKTSYFDNWCYGNIYEQIAIYKNNLSKMCLLGVSNETHQIIKVISLFDDSIVWEA